RFKRQGGTRGRARLSSARRRPKSPTTTWRAEDRRALPGPAKGIRCLTYPAVPLWSDENILDDIPGHVRQTEVASSVPIRELFVIDAHKVKDCRVIVMNVNRIRHDVRAEFVGLSIGDAAFYARTQQQTGKGFRVMISALAIAAVRPGSAAKFRANGDE